jgi:hypothetical protein
MDSRTAINNVLKQVKTQPLTCFSHIFSGPVSSFGGAVPKNPHKLMTFLVFVAGARRKLDLSRQLLPVWLDPVRGRISTASG